MTASKKITSLALLVGTLSGSAIASCPQIEGKYTYSCTVEKDEDATFADVLDVSGKMIVNQTGCEFYTFTNSISKISEDLILTDIDDLGYRVRAKVKKSTANVIKFKIVDHGAETIPGGFPSLTSDITKGTLREKRGGFVLKGRERSRTLGIFGKKHSKFSCKFKSEN